MLLALALTPNGWDQDCGALGAGGVTWWGDRLSENERKLKNTNRKGRERAYNAIKTTHATFQTARHRFIEIELGVQKSGSLPVFS